MMDNNFYTADLKSAWLTDRQQWNNDIVKYVDSTCMSIYFTEDKYHLKARVIPRGCRPKHVQETPFKKHFTEVIHRIGLQGLDGYSSAEELVTAFQHVINMYYLTSPTNVIDVLASHKSSDTMHSNASAWQLNNHINGNLHGSNNNSSSSSSSSKNSIEYIRGDRRNHQRGVTEYYV
jgi:hypothetical protein